MRINDFLLLLATSPPLVHTGFTGMNNSSAPIITTKVTPSYWCATFVKSPFNIQDNAWFESFYALVDQIASDTDVKVVVFDSGVQDFWIAHCDIVNPVLQEYHDTYWGNMTLLANLPILTIAAVQGIARGGRAELVAALDIFGSIEKAIFGHIEGGICLLPGDGGMSFLARSAGRDRALEIVLGAQDFDADTAVEYGWINQVIPDSQFHTFIDSYARRVASFDKLAISEAKRIINKRAGYPSVVEQAEDYKAFAAAASQSNVQARGTKLIELGLQTDPDFETHADQRVLRVAGQGPWNISEHST